MRVDKRFAPKTISIDTKEDEQFIITMISYAQEFLYSKNRWLGKVRTDDAEMNQKLNYFKEMLR